MKIRRFDRLWLGIVLTALLPACGGNLHSPSAPLLPPAATATFTSTVPPMGSSTLSPTPALTPANTATSTATNSPTNSPTATITQSLTSTVTGTPTHTATKTPTGTPTNTPTNTPLYTVATSPTLTSTLPPTRTPTWTFTPTPTGTLTPSVTPTPTITETFTYTPNYTATSCAGSGFVLGDPHMEMYQNAGSGPLYFDRFQATSNSTLYTMSLYTGPQYYNLSVWADDGTGSAPTSLLSQTGVQLAGGTGWATSPLNLPVTVANGSYYWLAYIASYGGAGGYQQFTLGVPGAVSAGETNSQYPALSCGNIPTTFGGSVGTGYLMSIYANGCPGALTTPTPYLTITPTPTDSLTPTDTPTFTNSPTGTWPTWTPTITATPTHTVTATPT